MFEQVAGYLGGVAVGWVLIFDLGFRGLGMGKVGVKFDGT